MKPYILPIMLQILGLLVIMAEIFIPSLGMLTLMALGIYAYSIYLVFTGISTTAGMVVTGLDLILVPAFIILGMKILAKSPLALQRELSRDDGVVSQKQGLERYINKKGRTRRD